MEKALWAAVMIQAIKDLCEPEEFLRSKRWFLNPWNDKGIGSFPWVCMALDMNPDEVLGEILESAMWTGREDLA